MIVFLAVGFLGVLLLVGALVLGDLLALEGVADLGPITTPVIGAALAAFGFGGALALGSVGTALAVIVGLGGALVLGGAAAAATWALVGPPTEPVRAASLLGVFGTVVTRVPEGAFGEVVIPHGGSRAKLSARSHEPIPVGTSVYVVEVLSETAVVVQRADFFSEES